MGVKLLVQQSDTPDWLQQCVSGGKEADRKWNAPIISREIYSMFLQLLASRAVVTKMGQYVEKSTLVKGHQL